MENHVLLLTSHKATFPLGALTSQPQSYTHHFAKCKHPTLTLEQRSHTEEGMYLMTYIAFRCRNSAIITNFQLYKEEFDLTNLPD